MSEAERRVLSVPDVEFTHWPKRIGFWWLRAKVRTFPNYTNRTLTWGFTAKREVAAKKAEACLVRYGALQDEPINGR